jgi:hypothetical protein
LHEIIERKGARRGELVASIGCFSARSGSSLCAFRGATFDGVISLIWRKNMKREDDQKLWDLLGRAAAPRLSPFLARNVLRQVREEPRPFQGAKAWLRFRILVPASGVALAVIAAAVFLRSSWPMQNAPPKGPETVMARQPAAKIDVPAKRVEATAQIDSQESQPEAVAKIDVQDYDVVANLDDLLVLYETSLWDENSSL